MGKKLLILGAGGHGKVAKEIALDMKKEGKRVYEVVDFLDDDISNAVGKIEELENFKNSYDEVFCGIGNNLVRKAMLEKVEKLGCCIPILVHSTAYISPSAIIEKGTIVEPNASVNANTIVGTGCIISIGSIVDHDVELEKYVHVNAGAICKAGSKVEAYRKLEAGEVVLGYC